MLHWFKRRIQKAKSYRSNDEWIRQLSAPPDEEAVAELRRILVRGLRPPLSRYVDRDLDSFVEDVTQDALLRILEKLDTFKGESAFVSWALKVAVRVGFTELRRKKWKDLSLDDLDGMSDDQEPGNKSHSDNIVTSFTAPDQQAHESMIMTKVMEIMEKELSEKQKMVIHALMIKGIPMTVLADQMKTSRNTIYKTVHDARVKLKKKMAEAGMDPDEILREL